MSGALLARRRIDDSAYQRDLVGREATATSVLEDDVGVRRHVHAVELVFGHVAREPTDVRAKIREDLVGLHADVVQLLGGELPRTWQFAFDNELRHFLIPCLVVGNVLTVGILLTY